MAQSANTNAAAYTFTTLAGSFGSADGTGSNARFNFPFGIAVDSAGNLYVADTFNQTIRKVTSAGVVSTLAGLAGSSGSADGTGSNARFNDPSGIAVDSGGNLYVADRINHTIRKITSAGVVSTLAGLAGSFGSADGTGSNARFNYPNGIAVDSAGNLYVADTDNYTIRKVTSDGMVSTLAGLAGSLGSADGTGSNAGFYLPQGIAVDSAGNLYVTDTDNQTIRKVTSAGVVSTLAGLAGSSGTNDGIGSNARFDLPRGIAVDSAGNLYVADRENSTIRKITLEGLVSTLAGLARSEGSADGTGSNARFNLPQGIAVDSAGSVYVTDSLNNTIRKVTAAGVVSTLAGLAESFGSADGTGSNARFNSPQGIAVDGAGNLYVADTFNQTIRKITAAGVVSTLAGLAGSYGTNDGIGNNARFNYPNGIAVDSGGNLYVAETLNHTIRKITSAGVVSTLAGLAGSFGSVDGTGSNARFNRPFGIAVDSAGNLYVADTDNYTIRKVTSDGMVSTLAGLAGSLGSADGTGSNARFNQPNGIAVDSAGNLYVADRNNSTIRKITAAGVVSTLAGSAESSGSADGTGSNARFDLPRGIAVDSGGNLYVAETLNRTIRKVTSAGVVSTLAGLAGSSGSADGTGSNARFNRPFGIAVDSAGNLYVADTFNHTIRKGVFTAYTATNPVPYTQPPMNGQLVVTLLPPEANGQWRFPWEFAWRDSGQAASNLVAGNYPIQFRNVPGYLVVQTNFVVTVTGGGTTFKTNQYYPTLIPQGASDTGTLTVSIGPNSPVGSGWRFFGEAGWRAPGSTATNLLPDTYFIEFAPVNGRVKPSSQSVQITPGLSAIVSANYLLASSPPGGVLLPFAVPTNNISNLNSYPFGFNGQLQTDLGYGSGVAVQQNVVLTAAHLVFNDQTLYYVNQAYWYFRKETGVYDPQPLTARSFFLLSGYAAQRTNDLQSGLYGPDQSTPQSRNLDVAALYFPSPVAGGGHGGYLPSDLTPNPWLTGTSLKMLVGYPVDGSLFGDASIVPGVMFQTDPQPYPLSLATDPIANQQIYTAPWFLSYPGNSGGPMYVQLNGYYYPAGVYLGTLYNGSQPYASAVRAIDSAVINLISIATASGATGTNGTGGGVTTVVPGQTAAPFGAGLLTVSLQPSNAPNIHFGWRIAGLSDTNYFTNSLTTVAIIGGGAYPIEFKPIPGFITPNTQTGTVAVGGLVTIQANYIQSNYLSIHPQLSLDRTTGLLLNAGATGATYRVEFQTNLTTQSTWTPLTSFTLSASSLLLSNTKPPTNGNRFYRAVLVP